MILTADRVRELLSYDLDTGIFTWLISRGRSAKVGAVAGALHHSGYIHIKIDGKHYFAHRVAWLLKTGVWPQQQIDHVNGSKTDNRLGNLREATQAQNMANRGPYRTNTSGFKGVSFNKRDNQWHARIRVDGHLKHIGYFDTAEAAAAAYAEAAVKLHGDFAQTGLGAE